MDYVEPGRVIVLPKKATLVLGYMQSCLRETISGGTVTVGRKQSQVRGGKIVVEQVECDGGRLRLTSKQGGKSAVLVLRVPPSGAAAVGPTFRIYGASPVLLVPTATARVIIKRLDQPSPDLTVVIRARFVDLAATRQALAPGGVYRATAGDRSIVFSVDAFARPGPGPIIGRLIAF